MVCHMEALFSMRVSMRTTSSVLAKTTPRARLLGVSQLGASVTMVSHSPRCSCCKSEHGAARHEAQDAADPVGRGGLCVGGNVPGVHDFLAPALYLFGVAAAAGLVAGGTAQPSDACRLRASRAHVPSFCVCLSERFIITDTGQQTRRTQRL